MGQGQLAREGAPRVGDSREVLGHHPRASTWPWPCGSPGRHMGSDKLPSPPFSIPGSRRERMGLDVLDPTSFSAEAKPRLREAGSK